MRGREWWDRHFMAMAACVARASKDPESQVGAIAVRPDRTVASTGYNGFPRGCNDDPALYSDRPTKLSRTVHAEMNAVLTAREPLRGFTMYVTRPPCVRCAAHIIQAGVSRVATTDVSGYHGSWRASIDAAVALMREGGVEVTLIHEG